MFAFAEIWSVLILPALTKVVIVPAGAAVEICGNYGARPGVVQRSCVDVCCSNVTYATTASAGIATFAASPACSATMR